MSDIGKAKVVGIFGGIYCAIIAVVLLIGIYEAGRAGLLTPDWWTEFVTNHQR